jgi:hypothetical protein
MKRLSFFESFRMEYVMHALMRGLFIDNYLRVARML